MARIAAQVGLHFLVGAEPAVITPGLATWHKGIGRKAHDLAGEVGAQGGIHAAST